MRSEKDKMLRGEHYEPCDPQLSAMRRRAGLEYGRSVEIGERCGSVGARSPVPASGPGHGR
jgi:hypothetical protein